MADKKGIKSHKWSDADDARLLTALDECAPLFEHFPAQGRRYGTANAWDAVAGRLLPDICVTGAAAKRHYSKMQQRREEEERAGIEEVDLSHGEDEWQRISVMVDDYEQSIHERNAGRLDDIDRSLAAIARIVNALARELGVEVE